MEIPENNNVVEIIVGGDRRNLGVKEYRGQRVVTLREIDELHGKADGTARKNFNNNKKHFIVGVDYFKSNKQEDLGVKDFHTPITEANEITLITKTGYLLLVKSFSDDLAWQIQRELVNKYFYPEIKYSDEYLQFASNLYNNPNLLSLGKGAQKEIGKAIANAIKLSGRENKKQKSITAPAMATPKTEPTASDLLNKLLSHAVPWLTFIPRSETELKSSILYDEKFYYIFPFATEKHMKHPEAKKRIYSELKFLDGKNKNKKFRFWFNNESKNYHIWILPRKAVMLSPLLCRDGDLPLPSPDMPPSAQPTGNSEK